MLANYLAALCLASFASAAAAANPPTNNGTCYYPDKTTISQDVPCNPGHPGGSSCCPQNSLCMSNGLCMSEGILSRGTCSDQTWQEGTCATNVCNNTAPDQSVSLTPCGSGNFICGLNSTSCTTGTNVFTLQQPIQPSPVAQLVGTTPRNDSTAPTATVTATASSGSSGIGSDGQYWYPGSTVIAISLALGFMLVMALAICMILFRKIQSYKSVKTYDPPDNSPTASNPKAVSPRPSMSSIGRSPTVRTMHSFTTLNEVPAMPRSFLDRYGAKPREDEKPEVYEMDDGPLRYELGSRTSKNERQMAELNGSQPDPAWSRHPK